MKENQLSYCHKPSDNLNKQGYLLDNEIIWILLLVQDHPEVL